MTNNDDDDNDNDDDDDDNGDLKPLNTSKRALNTNPPLFWDTLYVSDHLEARKRCGLISDKYLNGTVKPMLSLNSKKCSPSCLRCLAAVCASNVDPLVLSE